MFGQRRYEAVVIGVSAGGLNALRTFVAWMPSNFGLPVIIVQHVGAHSDGTWLNLLSSPLRIKEADEKEKIEKGTIYFAPANYHLMIGKDKCFELSIDERVNYARPSIDVLFETAAEVYMDKLIGIILTGSSSDGTKGLKRIKDKGGLVIAQDPATAESSFMPASAIAAMQVDHVLNLEGIKDLLMKIVH